MIIKITTINLPKSYCNIFIVVAIFWSGSEGNGLNSTI